MTSMRVLKKTRALGLLGMTAVTMSACSTLPTSGPTKGDIHKSVEHPTALQGMKVVPIDATSVAQIAATPPIQTDGMAVLAKGATTVDRVGPGDTLSIQIFEVGASLFSGGRTLLDPTGAAAPAAAGVPLDQSGAGVLVAEDGTIRIPYVGRVQVAGLTPDEVSQKITAGLSGKSQSPQVMVSVAQNVTNSVYMMGAVGKPGRMPITIAHERLLDAIAISGGFSTIAASGSSTATGTGPQDYIVQLERDGRTVEQRLESIDPGSADDIALAPGDRVNLIRQPRTFIVLGASDHIAQMPFESRALSLAEALARIGGPSDARADPRAIYVFRDVPSLRPRTTNGANATAGGEATAPTPQPTIYRLDMMKADGLFLAQRFAMQDKDVIYIANAGANQPQKLAQIIGLLFSPFFALSAAVR